MTDVDGILRKQTEKESLPLSELGWVDEVGKGVLLEDNQPYLE